MSLTKYRALGKSGLIVSPLALGTMTFGTGTWGSSRVESQAIFRSYVEAGGNFVDTADVYSGGMSEQMVGEFIAEGKLRDHIVLATKFAFNDSSTPSGHRHTKGNPNAGGAGAKNIHRALEGSLKRLKTDYIDIYWMHIWDGVTPVEEILSTFQDLVRAGKIRYFGFSDMPAWIATKASVIAQERRTPAPIAMQVEYSLVARSVEREHVPAAKDGGMAIVPWSPLAGGFLTGKYQRGSTESRGRLSGANPFGDSKFTETNWKILDVVERIAKEINAKPAQVALSWISQQAGVGSTIIGASKAPQLADALGSLEISLSAQQMKELSQVSALSPEFSDSLVSPMIRKLVYGGHDVQGWGEDKS